MKTLQPNESLPGRAPCSIPHPEHLGRTLAYSALFAIFALLEASPARASAQGVKPNAITELPSAPGSSALFDSATIGAITGSRGTPKQITLTAAGVITALAVHESGHVLAGILLNAHPRTKAIDYAGIPFFSIHHEHTTPRKEYVIASAGFWMQHAGSEWLLTKRPQLRHEHAPFLKGVLAFNIALSAMYAGAAVLHAGPPERDPRSMAVSLGRDGWPEGTIGAVVIAPALLDTFRYFNPDSKWAAWTSRALKVGCMALTLAASSHQGSAQSPP